MPPAASAAARRSARPPTTALGAAAMRVRWDRVGRVGLLLLLGGVLLLYVGPVHSLWSTWREAQAKQAQLHALQREHRALFHRASVLRDPRTLATEARELGLVRPGERPYVVLGLPRG